MWTPVFTEENLHLFDKLKEMGFSGIEILLNDLERMPIDKIRQKADKTNMQVMCAVALDEAHNPISPDPKVREKAVEFLKSRISAARDLNAHLATGVTYASWGTFSGKQRTEDEWQRSIETLHQVTDYLEETGVTLGLEAINRYETYFINTAEDAKKMVEEVNNPKVKVHLDTYHMNIEEKSFYEPIKLVGEDLCHIHLCENDRGIPGSGHVDWKGIFKALDEIEYEKWAVVETFVPALEDIARQTAVWRKLAPSVDELAEKALAYFKEFTE